MEAADAFDTLLNLYLNDRLHESEQISEAISLRVFDILGSVLT